MHKQKKNLFNTIQCEKIVAKMSPSFLWKSPSSLPKVLLLLPVVPRGRSQVSLSLSSVVIPGGLFSKLC
jgi:hypothetical protein